MRIGNEMIELFPIWVGGKSGYLYNVTLDGELVLERSRDPECDLARVLQARGISGHANVYDGKTHKLRSIINIEKLATRTVREDRAKGPMLVKWKPYSTVEGEGYSPEDGLVATTMPPDASEAA
jgi:hypothetical protein